MYVWPFENRAIPKKQATTYIYVAKCVSDDEYMNALGVNTTNLHVCINSYSFNSVSNKLQISTEARQSAKNSPTSRTQNIIIIC